jgi:hypothetical protein
MVVSDCANLIAKVNDKSQNCSHTGAVVFDIKQMATRFPSICFSHRSRACNRAAQSVLLMLYGLMRFQRLFGTSFVMNSFLLINKAARLL